MSKMVLKKRNGTRMHTGHVRETAAALFHSPAEAPGRSEKRTISACLQLVDFQIHPPLAPAAPPPQTYCLPFSFFGGAFKFVVIVPSAALAVFRQSLTKPNFQFPFAKPASVGWADWASLHRACRFLSRIMETGERHNLENAFSQIFLTMALNAFEILCLVRRCDILKLRPYLHRSVHCWCCWG